MATPAEVTGLHHCLLDTEARIDHALDRRDRRAFKVWCKRRAALIARIERLLLQVVTTSS